MRKFMTLALATTFALGFSALKAEEAPAAADATLQALTAELEKAEQQRPVMPVQEGQTAPAPTPAPETEQQPPVAQPGQAPEQAQQGVPAAS